MGELSRTCGGQEAGRVWEDEREHGEEVPNVRAVSGEVRRQFLLAGDGRSSAVVANQHCGLSPMEGILLGVRRSSASGVAAVRVGVASGQRSAQVFKHMSEFSVQAGAPP